MELLKNSERVVKLLDDHASPEFVGAVWGFSQRVVTACPWQPSKWTTEPWCVPETVVVGDSPVVVLDTKDWIHLSKGENRHRFEALRSHASKGVRFPISETAFEELMSGATPVQRQVIVPVVDALGLSFISDSDMVWRHEIESALDRHVGPDRMSVERLGGVPYLTDLYGFFGRPRPKLTIERDGKDVTEAFLREHPETAGALEEAQDEFPARLAKSVLREGEKTRVSSSFIDLNLVPHYEKAMESYQGMSQVVRDRFLRKMASAIVLIRLVDIDALATACAARGNSYREVLREGMDSYGNNILNVMPSVDSLVLLTMALIQRGQKITSACLTCAVERRCVLAGANPARQLLLRPEAIGAVRGGNETD